MSTSPPTCGITSSPSSWPTRRTPRVVDVAHWAGEWPWLARAAGAASESAHPALAVDGVDAAYRSVDVPCGVESRPPDGAGVTEQSGSVATTGGPGWALEPVTVTRSAVARDETPRQDGARAPESRSLCAAPAARRRPNRPGHLGREHRRTPLPELAQIAAGTARVDELRNTAVLAQTEIGDLDRAARKLDNEIDAVRARAKRDADRLAAGVAPAKDLENMQHEIVSLARRQATLEDEALELMEAREVADTALAATERDLTIARAELEAAQQRRDDAFADIDDELQRPHDRAQGAGGRACRPIWSRCTSRSGPAAGWPRPC